jgi:hypothetical protein
LVVKVEAAEFGTSKINYATDEFDLVLDLSKHLPYSILIEWVH